MNEFLTENKQDERELLEYIALLQANDVRRYLEIGSDLGGCLWRVATALERGSTIVSIDKPRKPGRTECLKSCIARLRAEGYDAHVILEDSTAASAIQQARALGPYDACLIDANHTMAYVSKDWANYGPMSRIVAFHDISYVPKPKAQGGSSLPIDVPELWNSIKGQYSYREIQHSVGENGIGVLWR